MDDSVSGALRIPPVLSPVSSDATTDYYEITMKPAQVEILPGLKTTIWGYNGQFPGPTIKARVGRQTLVRQINNLPEPMVVHAHGMGSKPESMVTRTTLSSRVPTETTSIPTTARHAVVPRPLDARCGSPHI
jgi:FtsP/CotA-like multicopper oxidase with cupredoxin domain